MWCSPRPDSKCTPTKLTVRASGATAPAQNWRALSGNPHGRFAAAGCAALPRTGGPRPACQLPGAAQPANGRAFNTLNSFIYILVRTGWRNKSCRDSAVHDRQEDPRGLREMRPQWLHPARVWRTMRSTTRGVARWSAPRVRSHYCFRNRGTKYFRKSGMKWMSDLVQINNATEPYRRWSRGTARRAGRPAPPASPRTCDRRRSPTGA